MIICKDKRFLFAAFNKTGTTSVENVLKGYNDRFLYYTLYARYKWVLKGRRLFKHAPPRDIRRMIGAEEWDRYFSFSFVRNPWSRAVSFYFFHRKDPSRRKLAQKSFEEWVRGGGTGTAQRSMAEFICDDDGNQIVNFVGRYENLHADFKTICEKAGLPNIELPHLNKSTSGDYRHMYTDETREIVTEWCKRDIETFGYEF